MARLPREERAALLASAQNSEMIRMSSKPGRIVLWILGLLALLIVSGVAMTRWKEQRAAAGPSASMSDCLCDTRFVEMCLEGPPAASKGDDAEPRRAVVPARCDCPEETDAEKLKARGWRPCGAPRGR